MKMITGVSKMCCDGVIQCLEKEKVSILIKDRHTCLDLNDSNMYVLKKGIVKVSLIMQDEREFNITYLQGPDVVVTFFLGAMVWAKAGAAIEPAKRNVSDKSAVLIVYYVNCYF